MRAVSTRASPADALAKDLSRADPRFVGPLDGPSHHRLRCGDRRIVDGGATPGKDPRQLIDSVDDVREQDFGAELGRDRERDLLGRA